MADIQKAPKHIRSKPPRFPNLDAAWQAEPDIVLEYNIPAEAGYDALGEPLREALEKRLLNRKAHVTVSVKFE